MSLHIERRIEGGYSPAFIWSVGQFMRCSAQDVFSVTATGDELALIRQAFNNLPVTLGNEVIWYGDHAKFVVANIENAAANC